MAEDHLTTGAAERIPALTVMVGGSACAIPLRHVVETMRPLPIQSIAGTSSFLLGVSIIRGSPVPVVDLGVLMGNEGAIVTDGRLVNLKLEERRVAILVNRVVGVRQLDPDSFAELPLVLRDVAADFVDALGARDAQLLLVLRTSRILPDEVWAKLAAGEGGP